MNPITVSEPIKYQVIDDLLNQEDLDRIQNLLLNPEFPWYYNPGINYDKEAANNPNIFQFTHTFYDKYNFLSSYSEVILPILSAVDPAAIVRVKANLNTIFSEHIEGGYHTDYKGFECVTGVFYVNTNNGYTKFINGDVVESLENRLLLFPPTALHTGVSQTDTSARVVININFFKK